MELFDKLLGGFKKKKELETKTQQTQKPEVNQELINQYKEKLIGLVYDEEVAESLAPVFAKLSSVEGFDVVYELLETKEKQIETVSSSDWLKPAVTEQDEESIEQQQEQDQTGSKVLTAQEILAQQFKQ